jgi:phosphoribosylglycinamide formyltransferase 1
MKSIAIFASGSGTNAERIIKHFEKSNHSRVVIVLTNNPVAGVIQRAKSCNVDVEIFNRNDFYKSDYVLNLLTKYSPDLIVLAGFLWLVPEMLIHNYTGKIINIHPALLPDFGGKGMYGMNVHKAVIESKQNQSGITIHFVNKVYDDGQIIFQKSFDLAKDETPESLAEKIHLLEYKYFPTVIDKLLE